MTVLTIWEQLFSYIFANINISLFYIMALLHNKSPFQRHPFSILANINACLIYIQSTLNITKYITGTSKLSLSVQKKIYLNIYFIKKKKFFQNLFTTKINLIIVMKIPTFCKNVPLRSDNRFPSSWQQNLRK